MAAPLARMFPPGDGLHGNVTVNGRPYSCAVGNSIDVPTFDAHGLSANGWGRYGGPTCFVGPTTNRPTSSAGQQLAQDQSYYDTTLSMMVSWDHLAKVWRGPSGAPA